MKIRGGMLAGRLIKSTKSIHCRPTLDKVKQALFNIIGKAIEGSFFVDLFAGTGNIGIEAYSRGANKVLLVEKSPDLCRIIEENIAILGSPPQLKIWRCDAYLSIPVISKMKELPDFIFADPPYNADLGKLINKIDKFPSLKNGGFFVLQHSSRFSPPQSSSLNYLRTARYGDTSLSFYQK